MIIITYKENNTYIKGILLSTFQTKDIISINKSLQVKYYLIFIPWKHKAKELEIISSKYVSKVEIVDSLIFTDDIINVDTYVSPFTKEEPYYTEFKIQEFQGYVFIYEHTSFIADVIEKVTEEELDILYRKYPSLLTLDLDNDKLTG